MVCFYCTNKYTLTYYSKDVIIPSQFHFGFKSDAVPGRLNQYQHLLTELDILWTMSELCGVNHGLCQLKSIAY
jgi:Cytochrome C oxidase subunit II, periplasmic domain